jgi:hypothetical protein
MCRMTWWGRAISASMTRRAEGLSARPNPGVDAALELAHHEDAAVGGVRDVEHGGGCGGGSGGGGEEAHGVVSQVEIASKT